MLTAAELKQIKDYLFQFGKKDSQLPLFEGDILNTDYMAIVRNGNNAIISVFALENKFIEDFLDPGSPYTVDEEPTPNSNKLVRSYGIYDFVKKKDIINNYDQLANGVVTFVKINDDVKATSIPEGGNNKLTTAEAVYNLIKSANVIGNLQIQNDAISWNKLDSNVKNIISTSAGQHGIPLSTELGNSNLLGITQKTITNAIGDVHTNDQGFISLQSQIDAIVSSQATVNLTAIPSPIFVGIEKTITLTAITNTSATGIKIFKNSISTPIAIGSGTSLSYLDTITPTTRGNIQYYAEFVISGITKRYPTSGFVNVQAVDKISTGSGATYNTATMTEETTPHAAGSFNKQIHTNDNTYLFIEIPDNFNLTGIKLVSTYETNLAFTQIETTRIGYKAYKNDEPRGLGNYTYKFIIANA